MKRHHSPGYILSAMLMDLLGTVAAFWLAQELRFALPYGRLLGDNATDILPGVAGLVFVTWAGVFFVLSVYNPQRSYHPWRELRLVWLAISVALFVLAGILYFSFREISRLQILYFYLLNVTFLLGWRLAAHLILLPTRPVLRVLIVGGDETGQRLVDAIHRTSTGFHPLEIVGYVDEVPQPNNTLPYLGGLAAVGEAIERQQIDEVIIAIPTHAYEQLNAVVVLLQTYSVQVRILPDYFSLSLHRAHAEDFAGLPLISLREPALSPYQRLVKRGFDLALGTSLLVLTSPVMALIALAIRLESAGDVIFQQMRVGENGQPFVMYKFRTMIPTDDPPNMISHKDPEDDRITRFGGFLRRSSLDELPQLINVLRGQMSLVGPRPEMTWLVDQYQPWQRKRFSVPPGITGWWQINGRSNRPMHLHTEDDLFYIQNYSLLLDLQILIRTIPAVLTRRGAY